MIAKTAPMGFNTWNTFGDKINEQVVLETADAMVANGYRDAGYEYVVIDDCWSLRERDENGNLVPDPKKFPHGMKFVADYVHSKGLKFGMYSCAGIRTCAGFPSSFDHEYQDARLFASWGVDFLKYDFCYFPNYADCKHRYLQMAMALRSTGRDILFSACNWGVQEPWNWMRSAGAHMYRSTGDIFDTFESTASIINQQMDKFNSNSSGCFNDIDMLTVGMNGSGNVARGDIQTYNEYEVEFAFWCFFGAPLMIGADIRSIDEKYRQMLQNPRFIAINQDEECRPPVKVNEHNGYYVFLKHLSGGEFAVMTLNLQKDARWVQLTFADLGIPYASGLKVELTDVATGECLGAKRDDMFFCLGGHSVKVFRCKFIG